MLVRKVENIAGYPALHVRSARLYTTITMLMNKRGQHCAADGAVWLASPDAAFARNAA
ncbi:hypothetical protein [Chelativorans sp. Marseille-P2723]|uniref:hypothetical protein n=1 Tax=Chelativorans sp. Marseille-P2723 TaxID=2709133 RepID=UPI00156F3E9C|nr:hypothetical protein [Chelativorans sp. Marseille-P2723]